MLRASYILARYATFWQVYWEHVVRLLGGDAADRGLQLSPRANAAAIEQIVDERAQWLAGFLEHWFDESWKDAGYQPYLVQQFWLGLPTALWRVMQGPNADQLRAEFARRAHPKLWFSTAEVLLRPSGRRQ